MGFQPKERVYRCDFCGRSHQFTRVTMVKDDVCICDLCVMDCMQIVLKKNREEDLAKHGDLAP